jgi:hypothetical protein
MQLMEADWELDLGGDAPVIDACWEDFIDLRVTPERVILFPETRQLPGLADALVQLNAASSSVWTSKCDVWIPDEFDRDELDAYPGEGNSALACYIDLLPRTAHPWSVDEAIGACKAICTRLRSFPQRGCRADLIVRCAWVTRDTRDLGVTVYLTACGSTPNKAQTALRTALDCFAKCVLPTPRPSTLQ